MRRGEGSRSESGSGSAEGGEGRTERVELRLRTEEKRLLTSAAEVGGEDLSSFMRRAGLTEARRLLGSMPPS